MSIETAYYYLFYKLYKFYDVDPELWWSANWGTSWKAGLSIIVLQIWLLVSFDNYYSVYTKKDLIPDHLVTPFAVTTVLILITINYFILEHKCRWRKYFVEFERLPREKNNIGSVIVWLIVLFIIGNLIFSFYLFSQIDWKRYR